MPKILINALSATTGGAFSVARGLSAQLAADCGDWEFELLFWDRRAAPPRPPANLVCREMPRSQSLSRRTLWEQILGPLYAHRRRFDAWLLLSGFVPFLSRLPKLALWQNAHIWTTPDPTMAASLRRKISLQKRVMRWSLEQADMNVFLSRESLSQCQGVMHVPEDRSTVIPLGLESEWLDRRSPIDRERREALLVMVGDIYPHKGHDLALRALALLASTLPALRLAIAGATVDPEDLRQLRQLARELNISDRVDFLGKLSKQEVIRLYERGLVYVGASRLETFGLTPLEAMACGLPVVSSRLSAGPEVCGSAAVYFDPYSPEQLAAAVADLIGSPAGWKERQAAGLARVEKFSWSSVSGRYREAFEALIRAESPSRHRR
jgi:glycosyltransferase involved in cell wall biosynthesis